MPCERNKSYSAKASSAVITGWSNFIAALFLSGSNRQLKTLLSRTLRIDNRQLPVAFPIELMHFLWVTQMNVIRNRAA
jgi:hypothetical protein